MKAVVLAAGEGTRLRPLTLTLPKPMVPIANVPLLVRTFRLLREQGIREIAVNLYHRPDAIRDALGDGSELDVNLHYFPETTLMGTAGGVKRMADFLDEPFLVLYGDNLYQADIAPLIAFHREKRALATLATFTTPNPSACGLVVTDATGAVTRFQEKPPPEEVFTDQANAGVYVLEPEVLNFIPPDTPFDFGKDVFSALLAAERTGAMIAAPLNGYLQDTGTVSNYRQANWDVLEGKTGASPESGMQALSFVADSVVFRGHNVVGDRGIIEENVVLRECILWEDCHICAGAQLNGAILGRNVKVGAGAVVRTGAILADDAEVSPGAIVPEEARVGPGEVVG